MPTSISPSNARRRPVTAQRRSTLLRKSATASRAKNAMKSEIRFQERNCGVIVPAIRAEMPPTVPIRKQTSVAADA